MRLSLRSLGRRGWILSATTIALLASAALIAGSAAGAQGGAAKKAAPAVAQGAAGAAADIELQGIKDVNELFKGIPQSGPWLGRASAPVQFVVFADLQCPFCKEFDVEVMPTLVREYVRTGKIRVYFSGMDFISSDSTRGLKAAAAASAQNRLWQVVTLLFINQGEERTGWLSEKMVAAVAKAVPGLDVKKFDSARKGKSVDSLLGNWKALAEGGGVSSTPTFFAGKANRLAPFTVRSLTPAPFRSGLDKILAAR